MVGVASLDGNTTSERHSGAGEKEIAEPAGEGKTMQAFSAERFAS
jgi:hypothetical protein